MSNRKRKCCQCKEYSIADDGVLVPAGFFCSMSHAIEYARTNQDGQRKRQQAKVKQVQAREVKAANKTHREAKERIKPRAKWLSELQAVFNKYVRLRDANLGCVSCDKPFNWHGQYHCGHYFSRGHSSSLRFNLWNCHKQCSVCNNHLSGNIGEYTPEIIRRIGQERFDYLVSHKSDVASYDVEWIKRAIKIARKSVKRLERRGL